jgi:hypothetical protein
LNLLSFKKIKNIKIYKILNMSYEEEPEEMDVEEE